MQEGTRCCNLHLNTNKFDGASLENINVFNDNIYLTAEEISKFLSKLRNEINKEKKQKSRGKLNIGIYILIIMK